MGSKGQGKAKVTCPSGAACSAWGGGVKAHTVGAHFLYHLQLFLDRENPQEMSLAHGGGG